MEAIQIVAVSFGGFLILLLLGLVFWRRNLTAAEYTFARIVLALACACVAVLITGFLKVEFQGIIQAGGGFAVFVIVYLMAPAGLQGSSEWQRIRDTWRQLHDLTDDPKLANQEDVARGLNAVNDAASEIEKDDSLFRPFEKDFAADYCRMYMKLLKNRYPIPQANSTSETQLTLTAKSLSEKLKCKL
jgi:hypothetical protein